MRTYSERWRFRHPSSDDFYAVASEVAGRDLVWFFGPAARAPTSWTTRFPGGFVPPGEIDGRLGDGTDVTEPEPGDEPYDSIMVVRRAAASLPVIELTFESAA